MYSPLAIPLLILKIRIFIYFIASAISPNRSVCRIRSGNVRAYSCAGSEARSLSTFLEHGITKGLYNRVITTNDCHHPLDGTINGVKKACSTEKVLHIFMITASVSRRKQYSWRLGRSWRFRQNIRLAWISTATVRKHRVQCLGFMAFNKVCAFSVSCHFVSDDHE